MFFPVVRNSTISTSDPFDMLSTFDKMFDNFYNTFPVTSTKKAASSNTVPRANIYKSDDGYSIELAAPGFSREEFEISVENNKLMIAVNSEDTAEQKNIHTREYSYSAWQRSWSMPEGVNAEGINARYEAGILKVDVPVENSRKRKHVITVE